MTLDKAINDYYNLTRDYQNDMCDENKSYEDKEISQYRWEYSRDILNFLIELKNLKEEQ